MKKKKKQKYLLKCLNSAFRDDSSELVTFRNKSKNSLSIRHVTRQTDSRAVVLVSYDKCVIDTYSTTKRLAIGTYEWNCTVYSFDFGVNNLNSCSKLVKMINIY